MVPKLNHDRSARPSASVRVRHVNAVMKMQMRQMQVHAAGQKRQRAQAEPDEETNEVEIRPGHERLLGLRSGDGAGAFSTSISRSASPGFSRIVPSSMRHMRESAWRAMVSRA